MSKITSKFIFLGNDECLDFINTEIIVRGNRVDLFGDFTDLAGWLNEMGYTDPGTAERLLARSDSEREEVLGRVKGFRAKLRAMIEAVSDGRPLRLSHIEPINEVLRGGAVYSNLTLIDAKPRLITHSSSSAFDPLLPIAQAAAELLTKKELTLIKKCSNPECILFFYDGSKNHGRRWCSMERCGNRMKAALHYKRKKGGRKVVSG